MNVMQVLETILKETTLQRYVCGDCNLYYIKEELKPCPECNSTNISKDPKW